MEGDHEEHDSPPTQHHHGYLMKESKWLKVWRVRYFVLTNFKLVFGTSPFHAPHGSIDLRNARVELVDSEQEAGHFFQVQTPQQTFNLCAEDEPTRAEWLKSIQREIDALSLEPVSPSAPVPELNRET